MNQNNFIEDKQLSKEKIEKIDNSINLEIVEKTVNDNLELLWWKFTEEKDNLIKIERDINKDNFKTWIEKIFNDRLNKNPDIIRLVINLSFLEKEKENQIENIIIQDWINLNTTWNLIWLENSLKEVWEKNKKETINYKTSEQLIKLISDIENVPDKNIETAPKIKELIKEGKFTEVINQVFIFLSSFIFWKKGSIWLDAYKDLDLEIAWLWLDQKTLFELSKILEDIDAKINTTKDINKKMRFTYILTAIKNQQIKKEEWKDFNKYELLSKNLQREGKYNSSIQAWQVLLLNKENKEYKSSKAKLWDKLLSTFNNISWDQTNFLHSVIVSKIEWNEIYITHSTLQKKDWKSGIEEKKLSELLGWYTWADILVMDMPDENKAKMLKFTKEKLDEQNKNPDNSLYDDKIVTQNITWYWNAKNEKVNCVELISEWLWDKKIKWVWIPNDLLESNVLRPSYLTSI